MAEDFFSLWLFPKGYKSSFIALIPKICDAKRIKDYRLLIGCQYKIVGKMLANCLTLVVDKLVSMEQCAFIPGRQILDRLCNNEASFSLSRPSCGR